MKLKLAALAIGLGFLAQVPAHALTLTNDDATTYTVEVLQGEGSASSEKYELEFDFMLEEICEGGCTIRLSSGASREFVGDEIVTIKDGAFVVAE